MGTVPFLECLLFVSTDKACSPVNVYGMCKCISERHMVNTSRRIKTDRFKMVTVRYGNVLASNGSLFQKLNIIGTNDEYTHFGITDERMTRFFMTLDQSVTLIINSVLYGPNGHICIPKIPSYRIMDIIEYYAVKYGKPIQNIGIRPGEKIHESMINEVEGLRTSEHDHFMTIGPDQGNIDPHRPSISYSSSDHVQPVVQDGSYIFSKYLPQDEE
jgi:UDP-N-acetylglucosamine 4,6-dehydratase